MTKNPENGYKTTPPLIAGKEQRQPEPRERAATECEEFIEEERWHEEALAAMDQPSLPSEEAWAQDLVERSRAWIRVARGVSALRWLGATSERTLDVLANLDREALLLRIQVYARSGRSPVPLAYADLGECSDDQLRELTALLASLQRDVLQPA